MYSISYLFCFQDLKKINNERRINRISPHLCNKKFMTLYLLIKTLLHLILCIIKPTSWLCVCVCVCVCVYNQIKLLWLHRIPWLLPFIPIFYLSILVGSLGCILSAQTWCIKVFASQLILVHPCLGVCIYIWESWYEAHW